MTTESKPIKRPGDAFTAARKLSTALSKLSLAAEEKAVADLNAKHADVLLELRARFEAGRAEVISKATVDTRSLAAASSATIGEMITWFEREVASAAPVTDDDLASAEATSAEDDGPGAPPDETADQPRGSRIVDVGAAIEAEEIRLSPRLMATPEPVPPGHVVEVADKGERRTGTRR